MSVIDNDPVSTDMAAARVDLDNLRATIARQTGEITRLADLAEQVTSHHRADMALIRNELLAESRRRGWEEHFDDVIENINGELNVKLEPRQKMFIVQMAVNLPIKVYADSEYEAQTVARRIARSVEYSADEVGQRQESDLRWESYTSQGPTTQH